MSIRDFLTNLVATFSGPRYRPEIEWSDKSWTHNFFRCFEWVFGRKYGIRIESSLKIFSRDNCHLETETTIYTFEAGCALLETMIRSYFSVMVWQRILGPSSVYGVPRPVAYSILFVGLNLSFTFNTDTFWLPLFSGAIGFDASAEGTTCNIGGGSVSYSHTCTGSDRILVGGCNTNSAGVDNSNSYGAGSFTQIGTFGGNSNLDYLLAPATGSNTASFGGGGLSERCSVVASYTGVQQSGQPDSNAAAAAGTGTTTVVAAGCWLVAVFGGGGTADYTPTTGTHRNTSGCGNSGHKFGLIDSNGTVGTGSQSLVVTDSHSGRIASFAPPASATKFLGLLGIGA